jgi:hypothetical protein
LETANIDELHLGKTAGVTGAGFLVFNNDDVFFCLVNLGGGEFEIVDSRNDGCLSINTTTGDVSEQNATGCQLNGGHGYLYDRWSNPVHYVDGDVTDVEIANEDGGGCIYGDTTPAEYVTCDLSTTHRDLAEWFDWGPDQPGT